MSGRREIGQARNARRNTNQWRGMEGGREEQVRYSRGVAMVDAEGTCVTGRQIGRDLGGTKLWMKIMKFNNLNKKKWKGREFNSLYKVGGVHI